MPKLNFLSKLSLFFLALSVAIYSVHYLIFSDAAFIFRYLIAQLGFLPLNVLLVTIVLNGLMSNRAKKERMQKLNMIIGAFFSDVGTNLLRAFARFDHNASNLGKQLIMSNSWEEADFIRVKNNLKKEHFNIKADKSDLLRLNEYLFQKHDYLLRLFENPNLLEHESFSQLLWAIFHLYEELSLRGDLMNLLNSDYAHLRKDVNRVYINLITQWLDYMQHIKSDYPYLYSLAMRTNPFNPDARVEVLE